MWRVLAGLVLQVAAFRNNEQDSKSLDAESLVGDRPSTRKPRGENSQPTLGDVELDDHLVSNSEGAGVPEVGIFTGIVLRNDFAQAGFWGRDCPQHHVHHGKNSDFQVYAASYNECNGVSDLVYYSVHADKFTPGAGRGGDWANDLKLVDIMKQKRKKSNEYATTSAYNGVGLFSMDRGHQAPVGSMNVDEEAASMTNTPTNLSPQSAILNRNNWKYLEMDMRVKASTMEGKDGIQDLEMLTGPLYQLPPALFQNKKGKLMWQQLLETGGEANKEQPWCKEKAGPAFRSSVMVNKKGSPRTEMTECLVNGPEDMQNASDDPNRLMISYRKSAKHFPLRAPLGYFKLMVMESGSHHGRRTCAFIMDQVGQCLLVSVELLIRLAHLDVNGTEWARDGGLKVLNGSDDSKYNADVNPYWCLPPGGTLRKKNACLLKSKRVQDPEGITTELMDEYWSRQETRPNRVPRSSDDAPVRQ